ncbi:sigma-70 family RNA polymerase sigma factor [Virgibacillus sp. C22-A2]|uniref:Sigma-70 family RNA polymerase sigma factor n=1 Tax=Virgibacillus tibetensis TaxID=3042313 RepID=A0ABU6KJ66_9BACI|nr:sigma-70 family RNA polymerase sigma factor [Virgibacillus sp. C22-A2]
MKENLQEIQKAIDGDDDAFLRLIQLHKVDLYRTALSYLKNQEEALEAVQEVTYRSYKEIHTVREAAFIKTWLIRIMINYCNDQLKKDKRLIFHGEIIDLQGVSDSHTDMELKDAMSQLDDRSSEILTLKYFNDLKIKDIAIALECPEGTVKTRLNKALKKLRNKLEEKGGEFHV